MNMIRQTSLLVIVVLLLLSVTLFAQQAVNSSGGNAGAGSDQAFFSFGQTVYLTHSSSSGSASEGVQQVDCPRLTASDTATCHQLAIIQISADQQGGIWSMRSGIGSSVDTSGLVTAGTVTGLDDAIDTVVYSLNGCIETFLLRVFAPPKVNAINGGPYCDGVLGHLYETGGKAVSWNWAFPSGFASSRKSPVVSPVIPGDYTVEVTDIYGCTNRDTTTVCVSQVASSCEPMIELALGANGTASFDPASLLTGLGVQPCVATGVAPEGIVAFSCDDTGGQGITYVISDSLGCEETCTTTVMVIDTTSPVEACEAMQDLVLVWEGTQVSPSALAEGSDDNCGSGNLEFSFSQDFSTPSLTLNCKEKIDGPLAVEVYMKDASGNVTSCEITLGYAADSEDCDCQGEVLVLDGQISPSDYKAKQTITSGGTVSSGATVLYKAEQRITLTPGFVAEPGSVFGARIDKCDNTPTLLAESLMSEVPGADVTSREGTEIGNAEGAFGSTVNPNPFRGVFRLELELPEASVVRVQLHQMGSGRIIELLDDAPRSAGTHELLIDGSRLLPGVYVLTIEAGSQGQTHKVVKVQ